MTIKLKDPNYLCNKKYQEDIEFIFQNSQSIFSYGFQKFYLADLEEVYLIQRRYKELYYIYKKQINIICMHHKQLLLKRKTIIMLPPILIQLKV